MFTGLDVLDAPLGGVTASLAVATLVLSSMYDVIAVAAVAIAAETAPLSIEPM